MIAETLAMTFFLRLVLGHLLGDFLLQPFWLVLLKRQGWTGLIIHVSIVVFVTGILIWGLIPGWWIWATVLWFGHTFIDQFRTFTFTDTSKGKGLYLLLLDQLAHLVLIGLLAWLATGWQPSSLLLLFKDGAPDEIHWLAYLSGLVILIWVAPVFEVEFTMATLALQGAPSDKTVPIAMSDRVVGGFERVLALVLTLLGLWIFTPLAFAPRLLWLLRRVQDPNDRLTTFSKTVASLATALLVGVLLLAVPLPAHLF